MKKRRVLIAAVLAILLASCVVKSLKPFYTKDTLAYDASLLGEWLDEDDYTWKVKPLKAVLDEKDNKLRTKTATERKTVKTKGENPETGKLEDYIIVFNEQGSWELSYDVSKKEKVYNQGYWVELPAKNGKIMQFIAMPFKIKGQLFLDFTPFDVGLEDVSNFAELHYVGVHTLAKVDKIDGNLHISWFAEERLKKLFEDNKIRIAHERVGVDYKSYLLTASSEELQKFIAKYMEFKDEEKWETEVEFVLEPAEQYK